MIPLPIILPYIVTSTISLIIAALVYRSFRSSHNPTLKYLALCFALLAVQGYSLALPVLIAPSNLTSVSLWHVVAIAATLLILIVSSRIEAYTVMAAGTMRPYARMITRALVAVLVVVIGIMIFDPRDPVITATSIHWGTAPLAAWILAVVFLIYGLSWAILFTIQASKIGGFKQRYKLYTLALDGALLGVSGFIGYAPFDPLMLKISSAMNLLVALITVIMLFVTRTPKKDS